MGREERDSWVNPYLQFHPHRQRHARIDRCVEIWLAQSTAVIIDMHKRAGVSTRRYVSMRGGWVGV